MHDEFEDLMLLYTTNSLDDAAQRERLRAHLAECESCRASLREWRAIAAAVRTQQDVIIQEKMPMPHTQPAARPLTVLVAMTALVCVALIFMLFNRPSSAPQFAQIEQTAADNASTIEFVEIVIAVQRIENGTVIDANEVASYAFPTDIAPFNAITAIDDVIGTIARTNIYCGQLILTNLIVENARDVFDLGLGVPSSYDCDAVDLTPLTLPIEYVDIAIAIQPIIDGEEISPNAVQLYPYPVQLIPENAITNLDDVIGRMANQNIFVEQPILSEMLVRTFTPAPTGTSNLIIAPTATATLTVLCQVQGIGSANIYLRSGNSASAPVIALVSPNTVMNVFGSQINAEGVTWYFVRVIFESGARAEGFVRADAVRSLPGTSCAEQLVNDLTPAADVVAICEYYVPQGEPINVYEARSISSPVVGVVPGGSPVRIIRTQMSGNGNRWYQVETRDFQGYISYEDLPEDPCNVVP